MNKPAANAQEARNKADEYAEHDADHRIILVVIVHAVPVDEVAHRPPHRLLDGRVRARWNRRVRVIVFSRDPEKYSRHDHQDAKYEVKGVARHVRGGNRAQDRAGNRRDREDDARFVIDPFHPAVGPRAGERIKEYHGERDARDQLGIFIWVEEEKYRNQDETAAGADQSSESTDQYPEREQPDVVIGHDATTGMGYLD